DDRLEHQLEGGLDHPVPHRGDPQVAELAAPLGDVPHPDREWAEGAGLEGGPKVGEERLLAPRGGDVVGGCAVHPRRAGSSITPNPAPRHYQEGRVTHEVVQVTEPTMRIVGGPSVQLRLDVQYPLPGLGKVGPRSPGVHRRPPAVPIRRLRSRWVPSPCDRLSRPRTTTDPPPRRRVIS